jgi:hypothetical protein
MKKTIISHFYNEEYLLPHWLNHHKKYFDCGILIDYNSTDRSVEIIKEICPDWRVVTSRNSYFEAFAVDSEVSELESEVDGFKICLNTTEFLLGKYDILNYIIEPTQFIIPQYLMVDMPDTEFTEIKEDLIKERHWGQSPFKNGFYRIGRSMHNFNLDYVKYLGGAGRHFNTPQNSHLFKPYTTDFAILYYGYCPLNETTLKRKLSFKSKLNPNSNPGDDLDHKRTREQFIDFNANARPTAENLSDLINHYLNN